VCFRKEWTCCGGALFFPPPPAGRAGGGRRQQGKPSSRNHHPPPAAAGRKAKGKPSSSNHHPPPWPRPTPPCLNVTVQYYPYRYCTPGGSCCCMHACGAACSCIFGLLRHSHPPPMWVAAMPAGCRQLAAPLQGGTPVSHTKITAGPPTQNGYGDTPLRLHPCLQHHPSPYAAHRKLAHFLPLQSGGASPLANTPASWNRISEGHTCPHCLRRVVISTLLMF